MILITIFKILLGFIFLKSSLVKMKKPYQFYKALEDYNLINNNKILLILTTLLIVTEQTVALCLILPLKPLIFLCLGVTLQLFYIIILFLNLGGKFKNNCECFTLNVPASVTTKSISINVFLLLSIFLIYGWLIRY
ncbi:MauE/DoxX family redox-associated membrane protein [Priestia filamentosa]|uniref:MauE/DoxX family redox-associated membrane protein n=1 Tax=Priestia filamentosa TaxID=1402861 RepID=UPI003981DA86